MPLDLEMWPYVVLGNGISPSEIDFIKRIRHFGKDAASVTVHYYADTLEIARKLAKQLEPWHDTVLICKIEEIVR